MDGDKFRVERKDGKIYLKKDKTDETYIIANSEESFQEYLKNFKDKEIEDQNGN